MDDQLPLFYTQVIDDKSYSGLNNLSKMDSQCSVSYDW